MRVKIENFKTGKLIPQCKRCQRYGHTQRFCQRNPVCVKCAGNHATDTCNKPKNIPAKCSNCAEAHPANYRGCIVAKELQKRRQQQKPSKEKPKPSTFTSRRTTEQVSYAEAAQGNNKTQNNIQQQSKPREDISTHQMMQQMMQMMSQLGERLDRLEARATGAIPKRN